MHISPINNAQSQFKARFSKSDLKLLVSAEKNPEYRALPKDEQHTLFPMVYTLLELLDKLPGKRAKIICQKYGSKGYQPLDKFQMGDFISLTIDNKIIQEEVTTPMQILYLATTHFKDANDRHFKLSEDVFNKKLLQNKDKTLEDIEKFALEG